MSVLYCFMGFILGFIVCLQYMHHIKKAGTLRIDSTDFNKDVYTFAVDDLDKLTNKKYVVLKVEHITLSHE